jgi:hypothetical protein
MGLSPSPPNALGCGLRATPPFPPIPIPNSTGPTMSNANSKFATRAWLNAATLSYLLMGGQIRRFPSPRPRGGRVYTIVL